MLMSVLWSCKAVVRNLHALIIGMNVVVIYCSLSQVDLVNKF